MITIDFNVAIAGFLSFCLILVFTRWVSYTVGDKRPREKKRILQCPYCTHLFPESKKDLLRCPFCKSILDENELKETDHGHSS